MSKKRKILYSPGYGAGWTSWEENRKLRKFMLEYKPFIDHLESGGKFQDDYSVSRDRQTFSSEKLKETMPEPVLTFCLECLARFGDIPYLGGLRNLTVETVKGKVRINEYDGFESIELEGDFEDWL